MVKRQDTSKFLNNAHPRKKKHPHELYNYAYKHDDSAPVCATNGKTLHLEYKDAPAYEAGKFYPLRNGYSGYSGDRSYPTPPLVVARYTMDVDPNALLWAVKSANVFSDAIDLYMLNFGAYSTLIVGGVGEAGNITTGLQVKLTEYIEGANLFRDTLRLNYTYLKNAIDALKHWDTIRITVAYNRLVQITGAYDSVQPLDRAIIFTYGDVPAGETIYITEYVSHNTYNAQQYKDMLKHKRSQTKANKPKQEKMKRPAPKEHIEKTPTRWETYTKDNAPYIHAWLRGYNETYRNEDYSYTIPVYTLDLRSR